MEATDITDIFQQSDAWRERGGKDGRSKPIPGLNNNKCSPVKPCALVHLHIFSRFQYVYKWHKPILYVCIYANGKSANNILFCIKLLQKCADFFLSVHRILILWIIIITF